MKPTYNPLTEWIHEYLTHKPSAVPRDAWAQLVQTAAAFPGVLPWLIGFDQDRHAVVYRKSAQRPEQRIGKASFARQFQRVRQL